MPFEIRSHGPVIEARFYGVMTNADLVEFARAAWPIESAGAFVPHRITDLRPVTRLEINFEGVAELARDRLSRSFTNPFKSAIIAPDPVRFGFARMFQTLNDHPQITIAIFPDEETAREWIEAAGLAPPATPWAPSQRVARPGT